MKWGNILRHRDGVLYWKVARTRLNIRAGDRVHVKAKDGYLLFNFHTHRVPAHRVVYELEHGPIPAEMQVDHRDRNRSNNHPDNLRLATHQENQQNRDFGEGLKGVYPVNERYRAMISVNSKLRSLGYFDTPERAAQAYDEAAREVYGQFAKVNYANNNSQEAVSGRGRPDTAPEKLQSPTSETVDNQPTHPRARA